MSTRIRIPAPRAIAAVVIACAAWNAASGAIAADDVFAPSETGRETPAVTEDAAQTPIVVSVPAGDEVSMRIGVTPAPETQATDPGSWEADGWSVGIGVRW